MAKKPKSAFFCLEGVDGSGKSTQIKALKLALESEGYRVVDIREPGGTALGEGIRELLLNKAYEPVPLVELLLFNASRAQILAEVILPALKTDNTIVLADRFSGSTVAYQGYGRGFDLNMIEGVLQLAVEKNPDMTFWLDIDLKEARNRRGQRGEPDRMELEGESFRGKVRAGYQAQWQKHESWHKIDANDSSENVTQHIFEKMQSFLA